jgi:hypothetical protein
MAIIRHPPYSPHLAPRAFFLFPKIKLKLKGRRFDTTEEIQGESQIVLDVVLYAHHVTRHNTPIHNILSTALQLNISQKALGTLPEDGNVMPKHVGATIHN